ncbi:MAG: twin-arginine translocase TatA/TatE family subunit [Phycisphaerales bacterium]|nr:MAG: twin-arginine translocase TatA/TatE family subunit [Phycisphaerales bacterium]
MPSGGEWIILLIVGLLIFGRRLPEVGRWLGQGIVEFKKGVKGLSDEIEDATNDKSGDRLADQSSYKAESAPKQTVERAES